LRNTASRWASWAWQEKEEDMGPSELTNLIETRTNIVSFRFSQVNG
jgi:hypothetical protein